MADTPAPVADDDVFTLDPEPAKQTPPKDPVTGKFVSPTPEVPAAPKHPQSLARQAADFGIEADMIESMTTPQLYRTVNLLITREREIAATFQTQRSLEQNRVPQPAPPAPEPQAPDDLEALVQEGMIDPRLLKVQKRALTEVEELRKLLTERDQRDQQREQAAAQRDLAQNIQIVDAAFAKLANKGRYGEGTGEQLRKDGKNAEFQRRIAALTAAGISDLRTVNRATIMSVLREADSLLFGESAAASGDAYSAALGGTQPAKPRFTQDEWNNGGVAKPSQRNGAPEPKGTDLAIRNLTARLRDQESQRTDNDELEGLPD